MNMQNQKQPSQKAQKNEDVLILSLSAIDASQLPLVGGKGANLGELMRAGLPVPDGFCVTTAAYDLASREAKLEELLDELATTSGGDTAHLEQQASAARERLRAVTMPPILVEALRDAYQQLTQNAPLAVAVRSSATAEDLPFASFAGQQDTILNVTTFDTLLDAVRHCWASLWNDRAVSYRASNGIDARTVKLAVVIQRMVDASVAGILFTANPLTGRRQQAVIDASPGLGEAVVSGAVTPDHFVVNPNSGEIVERRLGEKRLLVRALPGGGTEQHKLTEADKTSSLTDEQIIALAKLGRQVEAHFGAPQDTEWAIDDAGKIWLTQARPITTLYPLPASAPVAEDNLRMYFSVNVAQGVYRPFTPMGVAFIRLITSSIATFAGFPPRKPDPHKGGHYISQCYGGGEGLTPTRGVTTFPAPGHSSEKFLAGPAFVVDAAERIFLDATPMFRSTFWRPILIQVMAHMEARSYRILQYLSSDPRLTLVHTPRWTVLCRLLALFIRTRGTPGLFLLQALLNPQAARTRLARLQERLRTLMSEVMANTSASERLTRLEQTIMKEFPSFLFGIMPLILLVFGLPALAKRLLNGLATDDELQAVRRGLPHNPTTEMDLELWQLAQRLREDQTIARLFHDKQPEQLAQAYRTGSLPPLLQQGLTEFLSLYGHRAVAEIDMGLPRWSEDPTYLLGMLANYMQLNDPEAAPDVQFQRSAQEAEEMVRTLTRRARRRGWLRGLVTGFCLRRIRDLQGLREVPKFDIVLLLAGGHRVLLSIGEELVRDGRLEVAEDIFFITLAEVHEALAGQDMQARVRERQASYERELQRRHIPRILLSDGSEPEAEISVEQGDTTGVLKGTPASAGQVSGKARVILEPAGAHLEPGEILVAPSTDPGWTPLFFTASGLVMEMGGPMSHGAIVAREYGIPAVVGVAGAIEQITTGQQISVDGSSGIITLSSSE